MSTKPDAIWQALTPQARGSLRVIAGILAEKYTGQLQIDCIQGGVRSITQTHKVPLSDVEKAPKT